MIEGKLILGTMVAAIVGIVGLFGWSHKSMRARVHDVERMIDATVTEEKIRILIADKLAPIQVEYQALSSRLEDLKRSSYELDRKIEKLLDLLRDMNGKK